MSNFMIKDVDKMANCKTTWQQVDKLASWQIGKLTKWQVDIMTSWQNGNLMKWLVDKVVSWKNKIVYNMAIWQNEKLMKWQVDQMGLYHPLDGITNPKYKLLHFLKTKIYFAKRKRH